MERAPGIIGLTKSFREAIGPVPDGGKVAFAGSVAVCTPFAMLLAYAVRDRGFSFVYVPRAEAGEARRMMWMDGVGYTVLDQRDEVRGADVLVVLGGLAMPKFGCEPAQVQRLLGQVGGERRPLVVGVCFMGIFQRSGWEKQIPFDVVIDAELQTAVQTLQRP